MRILLGGWLVGVNREGGRSSVGSYRFGLVGKELLIFLGGNWGRRMILRTKNIAFLMDSDVFWMESDED